MISFLIEDSLRKKLLFKKLTIPIFINFNCNNYSLIIHYLKHCKFQNLRAFAGTKENTRLKMVKPIHTKLLTKHTYLQNIPTLNLTHFSVTFSWLNSI